MPKPGEPQLFGARLKSAIQRAGMTQRDLARRLHVTEGSVSNWVRGEREKPQDIQTLVTIAMVLHTSVDYLLGMPNAEAPPDVQAAVDAAVRRARYEVRGAILAALDGLETGPKKKGSP